MRTSLGTLVRSFFEDQLQVQKGLRSHSIRSYRDALRLYLGFISKDARQRITQLRLEDLSFERAKRFLRHLEEDRGNHVRTRNHRLSAIRAFYEYLAGRSPEMLSTCQQVAAIPVKRSAPAETHFLERDEIGSLLAGLPKAGRRALRDRVLLLFLYNTGARVSEAAELKSGQLDLGESPRVQLLGKGGKWRACPLWPETASALRELFDEGQGKGSPDRPVFTAGRGRPLTRFGIYKLVRRHASFLDKPGPRPYRVSPHLFRHTAAVHLLESGVEPNVIRGWLGHVSLETTNRYAEITMRSKERALAACEPERLEGGRERPAWKKDEALLKWLAAL